MKQGGIRKKVLKWLFVFEAVMVILVGAMTGFRYYNNTINEYNAMVFGYLHTASELIDGDRIQNYIDTGTTDDYYDEILNYLTVTRDNTALRLFYVFVPYEDDLVYVWQTDDNPYDWLGLHENYMDGGKETRVETFRKDPIEKISFYRDPTYGDIVCGFYPIFDSNGEPVALVGLDLATSDIRSNITAFVIAIIIIILAGSLIAGRLYYSFLSKQVVSPIRHLNDVAKNITTNLENDTTPQIDIHTQDELEELSGSYLKMYNDIKGYIAENAVISAEKGRIDGELEVAAQIQLDMLPRNNPAFPEHKEFDLYATMTAAREVGGDFYDYFFADETHLVLVIADVVGKGIPASIFMAKAMTSIRTRAMLGGTPSEILADVNYQMCERNEANLFFTAWIAIIDTSTWKGLVANAGHENPMVKRNGYMFEESVYQHSMPVGSFEGISFKQHEFELHPGDSIFVYTDGVAEATNKDDELFGTERLKETLNSEQDSSPEKIIENVMNGIKNFVKDAEQFDDITMMCIRYNGE